MEIYLITGGCGFIGSNFIQRFLAKKSGALVNLDALTYAGNLKNLEHVASHTRYTFIQGDITDKSLLDKIFQEYSFTGVINFAAESHVDRSIHCATAFLRTNVEGVHCLLEKIRQFPKTFFLQISTDEVYGSLPAPKKACEGDLLNPRNPYSASKASAEHFVQAFHSTYGLDTRITRCSNNYGPYQFPEKFLPLCITRLLENKTIPLYGDGLYFRNWIHVWDHIDGLFHVMEHGQSGEIYNIGGENEKTNLEMLSILKTLLGKPGLSIQHVSDRLGHDRRYAMDSSKMKEQFGWKPEITLETGLLLLVKWYQEHRSWWQERTNFIEKTSFF